MPGPQRRHSGGRLRVEWGPRLQPLYCTPPSQTFQVSCEKSGRTMTVSGAGHSLPGKGEMSTVIKEEPFQFTLKFYKVSHIFGFGIFFSTRIKKKAQDTHIPNTYLQPLRAFRGHTSITVLKVTGKPEPMSTPSRVMSAKEAGPTFSPPCLHLLVVALGRENSPGRRSQEVTDLLCQVTQACHPVPALVTGCV